jgi:copper oxidase (laccase) domain-containing protein
MCAPIAPQAFYSPQIMKVVKTLISGVDRMDRAELIAKVGCCAATAGIELNTNRNEQIFSYRRWQKSSRRQMTMIMPLTIPKPSRR